MGKSIFYARGMRELMCRHDAQTCYCGEPNCVGTIGGKTQTDIAGLDDLFIDGTYRKSYSTQRALTLSFGYRSTGRSGGCKGQQEEKV